jgi:hypothetical protein
VYHPIPLYVNPLIRKRLQPYLKPVRSVNHVAQIGQVSVEAGQKNEFLPFKHLDIIQMGNSKSKVLNDSECFDLENWTVIYVQELTFTDERGNLWPGYARMWNACVTYEQKKNFLFDTVHKQLEHYGNLYDKKRVRDKSQLHANTQKLVDDTWAAAKAFEAAYIRDAQWYFGIRKEFFVPFDDDDEDEVNDMFSLNA